MALGDGLPVMEQISYDDAVKLVGQKPSSRERKDLITLWGFGKKSWRWCMDIGMSLDDAIKVHTKMGEEVRIVTPKK